MQDQSVWLSAGLVILGCVLLIVGAEGLVRGASRLALRFGWSPWLVGLTVVAFGTSAPELLVSLQAVTQGHGALSAGNVMGSNIFNALLICGIAALIAPLSVAKELFRVDAWVVLGTALLSGALALDGRWGAVDGVLLLSAFFIYMIYLFRGARKTPDESDSSAEAPLPFGWAQAAQLVLGLGALVLGASWTTTGAVGLATWWGVSERIIGLTIVAAGTSLPELATSVIAALRGEREIAVGNVIGSNIFNVALILGVSAIVSGGAGLEVARATMWTDLPVMIGATAALLVFARTSLVLSRGEGALLLIAYLIYVGALISAPAIASIS